VSSYNGTSAHERPFSVMNVLTKTIGNSKMDNKNDVRSMPFSYDKTRVTNNMNTCKKISLEGGIW